MFLDQIRHFPRNLRAPTGGIEAAYPPDTADTVDSRSPKLVSADANRETTPIPCDDYAHIQL